jgi:hypothetical protein
MVLEVLQAAAAVAAVTTAAAAAATIKVVVVDLPTLEVLPMELQRQDSKMERVKSSFHGQ